MYMLKTLAIIGTAGRGGVEMTPTHWEVMTTVTSMAVALGYDQMISGGAAWADHSAVAVYNANPGQLHLHLCLPCKFHMPDEESEEDTSWPMFADDGSRDWRTNPGGTANHYHRKFSEAVWDYEYQSLAQIAEAIKGGATSQTGRGFHARNKDVVHSADAMLAMTLSPGMSPEKGGTGHAWGQFKSHKKGYPKLHIPLGRVVEALKGPVSVESVKAALETTYTNLEDLCLPT